MRSPKLSVSAVLICLLLQRCGSSDKITSRNSLRDGQTIISERKVFALGFFSPGSSKRRYVGIWYAQVAAQTVVWVANRDSPLDDRSGVLGIDHRGDLVASGKNGTIPVWSSNVSHSRGRKATTSVAKLLDSGNLVLVNEGTGRVAWQSFDYPTDSMLPFMKLGLTRATRLDRFLTSWKSPEDPGTGNFSYRINPEGFPQLLLYKGSDPLWRTGSWTGRKWSGVPEMTNSYIFNVSFVDTQDEVSITYGVTDSSVITRMVLNHTGTQQRFTWNARDGKWIGFWSSPKEQCDYYGHCGPNSYCDPYRTEEFECKCLPGFEPRSTREWFLRDGSRGCVRTRAASVCGQHGEGFAKVQRVKVPDTSKTHVDMRVGLEECEKMCRRNCSCLAYASAYYEGGGGGVGCLRWHSDMLDARTYSAAGQDLFVRADAAELAKWKKKPSKEMKRLMPILVGSGATVLLLLLAVLVYYKRKRENTRHRTASYSFATSSLYFEESCNGKDLDESRRNGDLPFFDLSSIAAATNKFSQENKLGEGGFGSVYKGILHNGKEIAIKRLSKHSGQGNEEFKNEITLIAKLQHRNLVRILGCCIEGNERMLIYEYLPNKSLDTFIFGESKKSLMDWNLRFKIICGIARGILYLHQDSRLRIIHRDLKASNVLLDASMAPKISDFGMARIFGGDQVEANTNRVVGTYGYMAPEYAMNGLFSIKSDVYSFGVLMLEIITGKRNNIYYEESPSSNLVGHVWDLWKEDKVMEVVDKSLGDSYSVDEIQRCIRIGLLCVQEYAMDRPKMSEVVFMLCNNASHLPFPNQPAFITRRTRHDNSDTWPSEEVGSSINEVTLTIIHGR